jgi:G3E family GTPase
MRFASAVQQIAFADKILLNKTDLVTDDMKQAVIKRIRVGVC